MITVIKSNKKQVKEIVPKLESDLASLQHCAFCPSGIKGVLLWFAWTKVTSEQKWCVCYFWREDLSLVQGVLCPLPCALAATDILNGEATSARVPGDCCWSMIDTKQELGLNPWVFLRPLKFWVCWLSQHNLACSDWYRSWCLKMVLPLKKLNIWRLLRDLMVK